MNYSDNNEEIQTFELTPDMLSLIKLKFEVTHAQALSQINKYYGATFEVKVGFISYYW